MPDTPDMKAALEIASEFITLADEGKLIVRQYDNTPVGKRRHKDAAQLARAFLALHAEREEREKPVEVAAYLVRYMSFHEGKCVCRYILRPHMKFCPNCEKALRWV